MYRIDGDEEKYQQIITVCEKYLDQLPDSNKTAYSFAISFFMFVCAILSNVHFIFSISNIAELDKIANDVFDAII